MDRMALAKRILRIAQEISSGGIARNEGSYSGFTGHISYGRSHAHVVRASFELKGGRILWHNGEWLNGEWMDGTWEKGTWRMGEWHGGLWKGGIWQGGTWYGGLWRGGSWMGGYNSRGQYMKDDPNHFNDPYRRMMRNMTRGRYPGM